MAEGRGGHAQLPGSLANPLRFPPPPDPPDPYSPTSRVGGDLGEEPGHGLHGLRGMVPGPSHDDPDGGPVGPQRLLLRRFLEVPCQGVCRRHREGGLAVLPGQWTLSAPEGGMRGPHGVEDPSERPRAWLPGDGPNPGEPGFRTTILRVDAPHGDIHPVMSAGFQDSHRPGTKFRCGYPLPEPRPAMGEEDPFQEGGGRLRADQPDFGGEGPAGRYLDPPRPTPCVQEVHHLPAFPSGLEVRRRREEGDSRSTSQVGGEYGVRRMASRTRPEGPERPTPRPGHGARLERRH